MATRCSGYATRHTRTAVSAADGSVRDGCQDRNDHDQDGASRKRIADKHECIVPACKLRRHDPEPMTAATRNAVPRGSAVNRRAMSKLSMIRPSAADLSSSRCSSSAYPSKHRGASCRSQRRSRNASKNRRRNRNAGGTAYRRACARCCRISERSYRAR